MEFVKQLDRLECSRRSDTVKQLYDLGGVLELAVLVLLASRLMTEEVHQQLAVQGHPELRPAHGFAFQRISARGGATGVELAAHLGITRQAAGQMIDELERLGYVVRRPDPTDARLRRVLLTDRGHEVLALSAALWEAQEQAWEHEIGPEAMRGLKSALHAWVDARGGLDSPRRLRPTW